MINRRHSKKREKILSVLERNHGALSAAEIHYKLKDMDITTVYRNLELFVKDGVVNKLNLGGDEAQYEYAKEPHHHAVCNDCHRVLHFTAPTEAIKKLINIPGFEAETIDITVKGNCKH